MFEFGIAGTGPAFNTTRHWQLAFLVGFAKQWKSLDPKAQESLLGDPWAFKEVVEAASIKHSSPQQDALLHLVFPDEFEAIVSRSAKQRIAKHSEDKVDSTTQDVDRQLLEIRRALTNEHGADFNFYEQKLIEHNGSRTQASGGGLFTGGRSFGASPTSMNKNGTTSSKSRARSRLLETHRRARAETPPGRRNRAPESEAGGPRFAPQKAGTCSNSLL